MERGDCPRKVGAPALCTNRPAEGPPAPGARRRSPQSDLAIIRGTSRVIFRRGRRIVDQEVQQQFGAVAANYVTSAVHARGSDLPILVTATGARGDELAL